MPRGPRIAIAQSPHHVVQRGHNRGAVFTEMGDYAAYLATLAEFRARLGLKVYAWCLMTNHVHLVIDPGKDARHLSMLMKHLAGRHTRRTNRLMHRTGSSWEGRFKCSLVDTDAYLLSCVRYVERNPVRAGMVRSPGEYPWSSYAMRMGLVYGDWLDRDPAYLALATTEACRRRRYQEFVARPESDDELELLRTALQRNQLTGSSHFVNQTERALGRDISRRARGRPRK